MFQLIKRLFLLIAVTFSPHIYSEKVLVIHSYHADYPWVKEYRSAFNQQLKSSHSLSEFFLDSKRLPEHEYMKKAESARRMIDAQQPDLVVMADDIALKTVGPFAQQLNIPVIFLGINANPRDYLPLTLRVGGMLERPLLKRSISELHNLVPSSNKALIILERGVTSESISKETFQGENQLQINGTAVTIVKISNYRDWKNNINDSLKQGYGFIILGNHSRLTDDAGKHIPVNQAANWAFHHSPVPVFAFWKFSVGADKAVGGLVLSGEVQGQRAAKMANYQLLHKQLPIPRIQTPEKGYYLFSESGLKKWSLKLPEEMAGDTQWVK